MKKRIVILLLCAWMLGGCNQKEMVQEATPTQTQEATQVGEAKVISITQTSSGGTPSPTPFEETKTNELIFEYEEFAGYVEDIAIADDGTLYAICLWEEDKHYTQENSIWLTKPAQYLYAFDENGACLWQMDLMFPAVPMEDLSYKKTQDAIIEWSDGFLYLMLPGLHKMPVLYRLNLETWEWQELYCLERFSIVTNFVFMEDRLYVHGILVNPKEKPLVQHLEEYPETYQGEAIGYIDMKNLEAGITLLPLDVPWDMVKLTENTLGIYQVGEDAKYFWKYTPAEEKWEKTAIAISYYRAYSEEVLEKAPVCRYFTGYEDGCFYVRNGTNLCYQTPDGTELLRFGIDDMVYLEADGIFLYYYYHVYDEKGIQRIRIRDLMEGFAVEAE